MPSNVEALHRRLMALEHRVALGEDQLEIQRLQFIYGFYIDNRMWRELAELFCDDQPSMEIGRRGRYVGRERIHRFLVEVLGQGRWGLLKHEIINHMQLQPVITVDPDRAHARMRSRAVVQGNSPPGGQSMLWAEGLYENTYVREQGRWRIQSIWWVPTFYTMMPGFDSAVFETAPPSIEFPPDAPSAPSDEGLGRSFPPFHYTHPFTGREVPSPSHRSGHEE